jgi:exopolyphosphatase/guanosine-5'-triphosphate,3'-diphosphate pyrophosphatase
MKKTELYAAVDLGSNSFHMIVAEMINHQLHIIDRHKDMVRLANGLDERGNISKIKMQQALDSLEKIGQRIQHIPRSHLRIVGTNTLRKAKNSQQFIALASKALGKPIDIISGREEARILYLGVAHSLPNNQGRRLVIDIGGGSTELIIGEEFEPIMRESLHMGCVSYTKKFFSDGSISQQNWDNAVLTARRQLSPIVSKYMDKGWDIVIGASGTMRATTNVISECGYSNQGIDTDGLNTLVKHCLKIAEIAKLAELKGLSSRRLPVFIGGLAIIKALFYAFSLHQIKNCSGALREGVVYDLSGRLHHNDVRKRTIDKLSKQFEIDKTHANRVHAIIEQLIAVSNLSLNSSQLNLLNWSSQLHELGLNISHSHFEKHAAYILTNADMPGFSNQEQLELAVLVALLRRKIKKEWLQKLTDEQFNDMLPLIILFRLATLLNRSRRSKSIGIQAVFIDRDKVELQFAIGWLKDHPLTHADLQSERKYLKSLKLEYSIIESSPRQSPN